MENKNIILKVLVIILSATVLILGGYIIKELTFNKDINDNTNETESMLLDKIEIEKYKNPTGTYGYQKRISSVGEFIVTLDLAGEVTVCKTVSDCHKLTNITTVVDMLEWTVAGIEDYQKVLFLLDNGDLYSYEYKNFNNNIFEATKIENITNVKRIVSFTYSGRENAGGYWGVIAITKNNDYIEVFRESI